MLSDVFFDCIKHDGIVSVASVSAEGKPHIANTWNKYLIVTTDEKILIPAFGFRKTEANVKQNPYVEVTLGSHEVQGKMGMGTGCLLTGTAAFYSDGELFEAMHDKCSFCNRVLVFSPASCKQTI
ncbi:pyridoxamine 5'-phosphate oxidase family protein [Selenomonas sp. ND2010]|uniref:pyridoxamine 5'-phosphate oxidase family protein n=1 Tax=Selenomonas sp. ND2010 TaxID=1410618 RepID=UPI00051C694F|nr:pyridoxamine 5'-phosphate oxidase family protein [Selenomonas sp. ND2010]